MNRQVSAQSRTAIAVSARRCCPNSAIDRGFHDIHQRAGPEQRPVLPALEEDVGLLAGVVIHAHVGQTQLRHAASNRRNVAVVDFAEVAFKVAFDLAGQSQFLGNDPAIPS